MKRGWFFDTYRLVTFLILLVLGVHLCPGQVSVCNQAGLDECNRKANQADSTCSAGCVGGASGAACRQMCLTELKSAQKACNAKFVCATGDACCGGACTNLSNNPRNCGACGHVCSAPANASSTCVSGSCGFDCNSGFTACDNTCCPPSSSPGQMMDQANAPAWTGAATNIAPGNKISQTFVPSLSCLIAVEAGLKTGNSGRGGDQVTAQILNQGGAVLASVSANVQEGYEGYWRFDLPDGLSVTPGQPLTIRLQDTGKIVFWWKYVGGNPYPVGQAYFYGSPFQDNDFLFKTYGASTCQVTIAPQVTIRYGGNWRPSEQRYARGLELFRIDPSEALPGRPKPPYPSHLARVVITTERRLSQADAQQRLRDVARSQPGTPAFYAIGGWPAVELRFQERLPRPGIKDGKGPLPPAPLVPRAVVAIAGGEQFIDFDIWLAPGSNPELMNEALDIAKSTTFSKQENPEELAGIIKNLSEWAKSGQGSEPSGPPSRGTGGGPQLNVTPNPPSAVKTGFGELEIVASPDASKIAIASNSGLTFSTNLGASFSRGNPGLLEITRDSPCNGRIVHIK